MNTKRFFRKKLKMKAEKMFTKMKKLTKNPTTWKALGLCALVGASNAGYCDAGAEMEQQVKVIEGVIFTKGVRMVVLLFGMSWGFFKTFISSSFQPILLYGGLGCLFFFIPKIIELIGSIGG
jgi:hypothetical protein